jgi:hypothetical protein
VLYGGISAFDLDADGIHAKPLPGAAEIDSRFLLAPNGPPRSRESTTGRYVIRAMHEALPRCPVGDEVGSLLPTRMEASEKQHCRYSNSIYRQIDLVSFQASRHAS